MASRSNTRNKIQALFSSFLHDKEENLKERKTFGADIAKNPGALSTLCQPRNIENFYERVETFSPFTWFTKPLYLSPQHCALYGWENTDVDVLTCVSCKATLDGTLATNWDSEMYNSICLKLKTNIIVGHSKFCPWRDSPCPESFLSLPARSSLEWKQYFQSACKNLLVFENDLPVLKRDAFQEMELTEDILSILSSYIVECDDRSYHQDIADTVCVMALCGWNASSKDNPGILSCSACHREAGLWNFLPLRGVSQLKSGTKESVPDEQQTTQVQESSEKTVMDIMETVQPEQGNMIVTEGSSRIQEEELGTEESRICDIEVGVKSKDKQRDEIITEEEMSCEAGITMDQDNTQMKKLDEEEEMPCGAGISAGEKYLQKEQSGSNEDMQCEGGMTTGNKDIGDSMDSIMSGQNVSCETSEVESSERGMCKGDKNVSGLVQGKEDLVVPEKMITVIIENKAIQKNDKGSVRQGDEINVDESVKPSEETASPVQEDKTSCPTAGESSFPGNIEKPCRSECSLDIGSTPDEKKHSSEPQMQEPQRINKLLTEQEHHLAQETSREQETNLAHESHPEKSNQEQSSAPEQLAMEKQESYPEDKSQTEQESRAEQISLTRQVSNTEQESVTIHDNEPEQGYQLDQKLSSSQEPHMGKEPCMFNIGSQSDNRNKPPGNIPSETDYEMKGNSASNVECTSEIATVKQHEEPKAVDETQIDTKTLSEDVCQAASEQCSEVHDDINVLKNTEATEACNISRNIEPSRLFGAGGVFSPVHSRQDSLIVEVGDGSLDERLESLQSELQDADEASSRTGSWRSLSEWSDNEVGEPSSKRLKTQDVEKIEFNVLTEHRNWCPWVTPVPSLDPKNVDVLVQKYPGWKIVLQSLGQCYTPEKTVQTEQTPPSHVWKSMRRLFHDCQTTILLGTGTKSNSLHRKV